MMIQLARHLINDLSKRSYALIKKISYTEYKHSWGIRLAKLGVPNNFGSPCSYILRRLNNYEL